MRPSKLPFTAPACGTLHPCTLDDCDEFCLKWLVPCCRHLESFKHNYEDAIDAEAAVHGMSFFDSFLSVYATFLHVMYSNPIPHCCELLDTTTVQCLSTYGMVFRSEEVKPWLIGWNSRQAHEGRPTIEWERESTYNIANYKVISYTHREDGSFIPITDSDLKNLIFAGFMDHLFHTHAYFRPFLDRLYGRA